MPPVRLLDFRAVLVFEESVCFILFVLFLQLQRAFPRRFFRLWIAGWGLLSAVILCRLALFWNGWLAWRLALDECAFAAGVLFLASALDYAGRDKRFRYILTIGIFGAVSILGQYLLVQGRAPEHWFANTLACGAYLAAGWILLRLPKRKRGLGVVLLGGAMFLRGLHALDRPEWLVQPAMAFRIAFDGLLNVAMGVAIAVLVLEAGREYAEDLAERLKRLALITASTQSSRVEDVFRGILDMLITGLGVSHGVIRLRTGEAAAEAYTISASVGADPEYLERYNTVSPGQAPFRDAFQQGEALSVHPGTLGRELRRVLDSAQLSSLILVPMPGKDQPLGLLEIGSSGPRLFDAREREFLASVANLAGLAVQNIRLFEQLADSQRQWMETFDSIDDLILVHDQYFRILRVNQRLAQRLDAGSGTAPQDLIGKSLREVFPRGAGRWTRCPYCEGVEGSGDRHDSALGGFFLVTNSALHDSSGQIGGTIHVLTDWTERREAESKFRTLFGNMHEGLFFSTPAGRLLDFNDALMHMHGYDDRKEFLAVDLGATYCDPSERTRLKRLLQDHGRVSHFEFRFRRRDGEIRIALESSFATRNQAGEVVSYQGFVLDVTEQRKAEQEIRRRNRELTALNAISQLLTQSLGLEEVLNLALPRIVALLAADLGALYLLDENSLVLRRVASWGHQSHYAEDIPPIMLEEQFVQQIRRSRARILSGSGLPLPQVLRDVAIQENAEAIQIAILWSKDRVLGALAISSRRSREFSVADLGLLAAVATDLSATIAKSLLYQETRRAYENLQYAQEQLLQSEKMAAIGQLISGVAHELNNPLTAILGYTQLLQSEGRIGLGAAEYVEKIHKQAQRTHHIVQNLLSFSRQHKPERVPVEWNRLLEETIALREYDIRRHEIRVHRELAEHIPGTLADPHQLQQVFLNILNNAVDAVLEADAPRDIWIRTAVTDDGLIAEFVDSGKGVADHRRVFDPFYTTKPVGKGTGLGLSICYGIVKEHGGELQVCNLPPRGACFRVLLPVKRRMSDLESPSLPPAEDFIPSGTILLVDKDETVLELEKEILLSRGFAVYAVQSAREAMFLLEQNPVDAIVTEMCMPGDISGFDLHAWVENRDRTMAARMLFTFSSPADKEEFDARRKNDCAAVQKPFTVGDFWSAIQSTLLAQASDAMAG